jgi:hypothetical protein
MNDNKQLIDDTQAPAEFRALILQGEGYELIVPPEAEALKQELMAMAGRVLVVNDNDSSAEAQHVIRKLAEIRNKVDKGRELVKKPVLAIGKEIDKAAKDFVGSLKEEEDRIRKLVGSHAEAVALAKAQKEAEERRAFEAARKAREEAEAAQAKAAGSKTIADVIAAKQAEREREAALAARMEASAEVAASSVAQGVRFAIDFEVTDMELLMTRRDLVEITPRRAIILAELKAMEVDGNKPSAYWASLGLRVFNKPVVASR